MATASEVHLTKAAIEAAVANLNANERAFAIPQGDNTAWICIYTIS